MLSVMLGYGLIAT